MAVDAVQQEQQRGMEVRARYLVLLLLAEGPKTGYELMKSVRSLFGDEAELRMSPGTLYPLLHSLEREGLLEAVEEPRGGRRRRVYRVTRRGLEQLLEMMLRGLAVVEASLRVHIEAARRVAEAARPEVVEQLASRLERIERLTRQLRLALAGGRGGGDGSL